MRLLLIRHAQSSNNAVIKAEGDRGNRVPEPELTDLGIEQAHHVAAALPALVTGSVRVSSSLMTRALQTGSILADALNVPVHTCPDLHEAGGIYDGGPDGSARHSVAAPSLAQLRRISPRIHIGQKTPDPWWVGPYEPAEQRDARARTVLAELVAMPVDTHVVVIHQHFGQHLIRALLGAESMSGYLRIDNTGTSLFERPQNHHHFLARWINRTEHLPAHLITD
ncbi:histidine phosphatase family protein [Gephyromycinifex aptenodytis]|uniref:histidine phosphatase family protein n=1 Tax=Gephyromycinifex aptenodytis TaxID=2716227 RepID=UPI001444C368|nr:histidine phosphatase family protein [Gephyromycinifex aptenodytis]